MKSVLISIRPQWVEKICHKIGEDETGKAIYEKRIEVRKSAPQEVPFKAYIYCCKAKPYLYKEANPPFELFLDSELYKGNGYDDRLFSGKVIGEFICDKVDEYPYDYCDGVDIDDDTILETAIDREDINIYAKGKTLYGWHISDLKIYDKPKELCNFVHRKKYDWWDYGHYTNKPQYEWEYISRPPQSWQYVKEREE